MGLRALLRPVKSAPLESALDDEVARLDRVVLYGWQGLGLVVVFIALSTAVLVPGFGYQPALYAIAFVAWWALVAQLAKNEEARAVLVWVNAAVESATIALAVGLLTATQGPEYALGSWVPPMIYGCVVAGGILRLRPVTPLVVGAVGAVLYELTYAFYVCRHLSPEALRMPLFSPHMQLVRSISVVVGGALASAVTLGLRNAIGKAARTARSQDLFGKYRLERPIASGGMATVYAATYCPEGGFARPVAVKRIHPHLARQESFVDAFRNEAEICARLVHPNIVQVFDFGRVDQTYFLAMEYVDGVTLNALMLSLRRNAGLVSPRLVAWIGREMVDGLVYSHTGARDAGGGLLRVVHRDLSPANVLISKNGEVKLSDFGIARALRGARAYMTDSIAGHLSYMAPEQATGHETDERSDLFAVGVILWELLCGRTLFRREYEASTLNAILHDPVPAPSSERNDLDEAPWDPFFAHALEREPDLRFQSAREMWAALGVILERVGSPNNDELALLVARAAGEVIARRAGQDAPTVSARNEDAHLANEVREESSDTKRDRTV